MPDGQCCFLGGSIARLCPGHEADLDREMEIELVGVQFELFAVAQGR